MSSTSKPKWETKVKIRLIPILLSVFLLAACGGTKSQPNATPSASASSNPYGSGFAVSPPADTDVVLTIKGSKSIDFTMKQLRDMTSSSITIKEPFVKTIQTFGVISLKSLFADEEPTNSSSLNTVALNDYAFKAPAKDFFGNSAFLAISRNGKPIPMDAGGPIRIVFDKNSKWFSNVDAWNWSLRSIEIV